MLGDPILFYRWGIVWHVHTVCLTLAPLLMILGVLQFVVLVKHTHAQARRLSAAEAGDTAFNAGKGPMRTIQGKGVGGAIELSASIGSLRQAARRGDWLTFWLWPLSGTCWLLGFWLLFSAFVLESLVPWVLVTVFFASLLGAWWFLPFAAVFTKIDMSPVEQSALAQAPRR